MKFSNGNLIPEKMIGGNKGMTPAELKARVEQGHDRFFFSRDTMRFFGDTMRNYGVRDNGDTWELYRKHPVKHGLRASAYFDKVTFDRVFKGAETGI